MSGRPAAELAGIGAAIAPSDMLDAMPEIPPPGSIAPTRSLAEPMDVPVRPRNPGMPLDLEWLEEVRINRSAVERRAATLRTRRTVKKEWQAAWLLRAVTLMDLTTLSSDDTPGRVRRLCAKALECIETFSM